MDPAIGTAADWTGREIGTRVVSWTERDVILYHIALGASAEALELVFERDLKVHPLFGLTLTQWAPDELGAAGAFSVSRSVAGGQGMSVTAPLPPSGSTELTARVAAVWDKGAAAVFEVEVACEYFRGTTSIFAPGAGGFGGERGPGRALSPQAEPEQTTSLAIDPRAAVLYRLTGDRHLIHVDPAAAREIGQPRPILHGLATLGTAVLALADQAGARPWELTEISGRFSSTVFPGEQILVDGWSDGEFRVRSERDTAIDAGRVVFAAGAR